MSVYVLGLKSGDTTAESHRFGLSVFMQPATGRTNRRSGIAPSPTCADLVAVSAMQAKVSAFIGWIDGTSSGVQAGYPFVSDGDVVLTFDAGEPSVARVDRVIARVRDSAYDSSGQQAGSVEVLKGDTATGAATALPPTSLLLWEVTVPAGASAGAGGIDFASARVDRRTMTSALGGVVIVRDAADRDTMDPYEGLTVWRSDVKALQVYSDGQWRSPLIISAASAASRDVLVPNPRAGQLVHRTDFKGYETYNGSAWVTAMEPEQRIKTAYNGDAGYTVSTTYSETLTDAAGYPMNLAFTAPASGSVLIILSVNLKSNTAGTVATLSANVRQNGAIANSASDERQVLSESTSTTTGAVSYSVNGLTPGASCTVTPAFRSSSGSVQAHFDAVRVTVIPV